jgi:IS1 family transposase
MEQGDPCGSEDAGERWGCMSIDRASRFVVAWASGPRVETLADTVVTTTRRRTAGQVGIPYLSDGWKPYEEAVRTTYRDREPSGVRPGWDILRPTEGVRLTQAVKHRKGRRLIRVEVRATIGEPVEQPYPVHIERFNGVLRDRLGCLTRKTHAFAKDIALWDALFSVTLFEHNWIRPHIALRLRLPQPDNGRRYAQRTPAMAIGLTDHPWTWSDFVTTRGKAR